MTSGKSIRKGFENVRKEESLIKKIGGLIIFFIIYLGLQISTVEAAGYTNNVKDIPAYATWAVEDLNYGIFYYSGADGYQYSTRNIHDIPDNAQWVLSTSQYSNFYFRGQDGKLYFETDMNALQRNMYWIFRSSVQSGIHYASPDGTVVVGTSISEIPLNARWVIPGTGSGNFYYGGTQPNRQPNVPAIDNIANGQILNHNNPTICWNFSGPDTGDYQTAFQLVGSTTNWASWQYNSGELASGNRCFSLPSIGDGDWHFAVRVRDNHGNWSADWGYLSNIKLDTTKPTYTSHTPTGRKLNATTFRLEAQGVSDTLSGVKQVMVGTWTDAEGVDNAKWQNLIHTGGGSWATDISVANHSRYQGNYYSNIYIVDQANNQIMIPTITTVIDQTPPRLVLDSIEGANYVFGTDYWVKPNQSFVLKVRANDPVSGLKTTEISLYDFNFGGDEAANALFDWSANSGEKLDQPSVHPYKWNHFTYSSMQKTATSGEVQLMVTANPTATILTHDTQAQVSDYAGNYLTWVNLNKRIIIDGEKPTASINQSNTMPTRNNVILTATGSDGNGSGMKRIKLPDGTSVSGSTADFVVSANGTYAFEMEDNVGNVSIHTATVHNIDKTAPSIRFTPETIEGELKDLSVQLHIEDLGISGYKQVRHVWTKDEIYPAEGWSEWSAVVDPTITQSTAGKWYLHIEAADHAGNISYAKSGIYEKIALSGGPSVNIHVYPLPTGVWYNKPMDVYVMDSGDSEVLSKAKKQYQVTNNSLYPSDFNETLPLDKKVPLTLQGENFIHVQYVLDDGTKMSSTAGPYLIDTGGVGDFQLKLTDVNGIEVADWSSEPLKLVISDPSTASVSGIQKQYRVEGIHQEWQPYMDGMTIQVEGNHRVFGRIVKPTGVSSEQRMVVAKIDQTPPSYAHLLLQNNDDHSYNVTVQATDSLSSVKDVMLNDGTKLAYDGKGYGRLDLTDKPSSVTITDQVGNYTVATFNPVPVIAFESPYTLEKTAYRGEVVAVMEGTSSYLIGWKKYECAVDGCKVSIEKNTTITAIKKNGKKESRTIVKIDNLEKGVLTLVLNGMRNLADPTKLVFEWNYDVSEGQLACTEDSVAKTYAVSGKTFVLTGKNTVYDCYLEGQYEGESMRSNKVMIFADTNSPIDGMTVIEEILKETNVHVDENSTGDAYMINTKSDNYKKDKFPFPKELF